MSEVNLAQLKLHFWDFSMYGFAVTDAAGTPTATAGEEIVYVAMDAGDDLFGLLSSYSCLTVVPTPSAPTLTKQLTLAVQSLTMATESGVTSVA